MISRLFLLNRESSVFVQTVFLLRQNTASEREVRGRYVLSSRAFSLIRMVFCATSCVLGNTAVCVCVCLCAKY